MFEQSSELNKDELTVELRETGVEMSVSEYEKYKNVAIDFLNHKDISQVQELSNSELVKLGEVALQMAKGLEKFSDIIEQSRSEAKD